MQSLISDVAGLESVIQQSTEHDQRVGGPPRTIELIRHISLNRLPGGCFTS
jgi:hypothetical protein